MARIALIGPGAIGGTVAVRLGQTSAHSVIVCARSRLDGLVLDAPEGQLSSTPEILLTPEHDRVCDWVLVATKAYDVAAAAVWFPCLVDRKTRLAVLQNGVEHIDRFRPYIPEDRIVPVVVSMSVERTAPGHFWQRQKGRLTVADTPNGRDFSALFVNSGIDVSTSSDFKTELWRKLAQNCAGAVSALVLKPAIISRTPDIADIMRELVRECISVGQAEGATFDTGVVEAVIRGYQNGPPDAVNSLHADRLADRPIEIDARNGAVLRLGRKHGIKTPVNQMIVTLLKASASTARP